MSHDKVLSSLSLCKKAGFLACGEFQVEEAVKSNKGHLVIIAADAGDRTKKDVNDMCRYYRVPCFEYATKDTIGSAVGKGYLGQVCVTDKRFSESIKNKLELSTAQRTRSVS